MINRPSTFILLTALATTATAWIFPLPILGWLWLPHHQHGGTISSQTVAFACYGGGGNCECPKDKSGDSGVLINVYPGYQCAYPGGACTWNDADGSLQNTQQTNCPSTSPCSTSAGCSCPRDKNNDTGVLINQFTGYQCAYKRGACTWDFDGNLQNTGQTNCPTSAKCVQSHPDGSL